MSDDFKKGQRSAATRILDYLEDNASIRVENGEAFRKLKQEHIDEIEDMYWD